MNIEHIRDFCAAGSIAWTNHALTRMLQRGLSRGEVKSALIQGEIIEEYPDDDLELKRDGETITLKDTYTAYPWDSGIEVPDSCSVAPTAPAAIVETPVLGEDGEPLVDENGEPLTELTLSPLGEVDAPFSTVELTEFFEEHPNKAGWIYVATLYYDMDGNVAALTIYEQPIAYPLTGSSDAPAELPSEDDECCAWVDDELICECDELYHPGGGSDNNQYCGHETCWCYNEIGPGRWDYEEDIDAGTGIGSESAPDSAG